MSQDISNKIIDRREDDYYPFRKRIINYGNALRFYILPISSVVIFVLIIIFAVIPNVSYMLDGLSEAQKLADESEELNRRIKRLDQLTNDIDRNKLLLEQLNNLVPTENTQVVNFRQKVAEIGERKGLEVESLKAGELIIEGPDVELINQGNSNLFSVIEIPSTFSFSGNFSSYRELLKDLYAGDDFFVVSKMDLNLTNPGSRNQNWQGEFDLIKYQFTGKTDEAKYLNVSEFSQVNQRVVKFIEENFVFGDL